MKNKPSRRTIQQFGSIIGKLEAWQHRPDVPEQVNREVNQLKSRLIALLNQMEAQAGEGK